MEKDRAVVLLSGGMDSSTALYHMRAKGFEVYPISFDYGQRHRRELEAATRVASEVGVGERHRIVDIGFVREFGLKSALVNDAHEVPHGHYAQENMRVTVVPYRNPLMLLIAFQYAASIEARFVGAAVHAGDHDIYPDCRPLFIDEFKKMVSAAMMELGPRIGLFTPFLYSTKMQIAQEGVRLQVPWHLTWSCYEGGPIHCGKCGTCVERLEALDLAGAEDLTEYADREYWRTVTKPKERVQQLS